MDGQEFDRIARIWASSADRRRTLHVLGAALLTAGGWWRWRQDATAQETTGPLGCAQDADCLGEDLDPCTGATCLQGRCMTFVVDCLPGDVCCDNGSCCPAEETSGCLADTDCVLESDDPCQGVRCEEGSCVPFLVECAPDFACCGNGACCPLENGCAADADCAPPSEEACSETRCFGRFCVSLLTICPPESVCRDGACAPIGDEPM